MDVLELEGPGGGWRVLVPRTRRERMRGRRSQPPPGPREGLLLRRCRSVHTFGMRSPIVVASLDDGLVVRRCRRMVPRRVLGPRSGVRHILECGLDAELRVGDRFRRPAAR